jgi:hypothetical protein
VANLAIKQKKAEKRTIETQKEREVELAARQSTRTTLDGTKVTQKEEVGGAKDTCSQISSIELDPMNQTKS